jgi:hypothetical protein
MLCAEFPSPPGFAADSKPPPAEVMLPAASGFAESSVAAGLLISGPVTPVGRVAILKAWSFKFTL